MMDKSQKGYLIILFLLSPFLGVVNLFKAKDDKFYTFFGTFFFGLVGSVFVHVEGSDGYSHLMKAKEHYLNMSLLEFLEKSYEILTFNSTKGSTDIYLHIISFISGSLLQTPELVHVFAGFVLGYFFTKSVLLLLKDHFFVKKNYILIGFIVLFLLTRSISALNSIRMWTGMWVLFYGVYSWALSKEKKYIFVILFSVFVHFSYAVILIPVISYYMFRNNKVIIAVIYATSFFASIGFSGFTSYIPKSDLIEKKQKSYVIDSDEKADLFDARKQNFQEKKENLNFYKAFGEANYLNYSIVGLSVVLLIFYFKKTANQNLDILITIGVGLYSFANLVAFSPSLQGRTKMIASVFILAAAIYLQLNLKNYHLNLKQLKLLNGAFVLFLISVIPMLLFQISYILQNTSFFILLFPQISWLLGENDFSLRTALGFFID